MPSLRTAQKRIIGRPFLPGNSANPGGRPKQLPAVREAKARASAISPAVIDELEAIVQNHKLKLADRLRACELLLRAGNVFDDTAEAGVRRILVEYVSPASLDNGNPA